MAWEQTARLQQLRALQEARALGRKLYFLQAVDQAVVGTLTSEQAKQALQVLNMGKTGYLMGMCPLYIGMPVRTSANTEDVVLTRELACTVRRIELHPHGSSAGLHVAVCGLEILAAGSVGRVRGPGVSRV